MLAPIAGLCAVAAVGYAWRRLACARFERDVAARRPVGPDGVVVGAGSIDIPRAGAPAVLLLHGGGDTPQTMGYLAAYLAERGYAVRAPLLPGHGRTLRDFATVTADALTAAVRAEYERLRAEHSWVAVIGLSMGGALALQLAGERDDIPALGLVAPYVAMPPRVRRAARLAPYWGVLQPYLRSTDMRSIHDPVEMEKSRAFGVFSAPALYALYTTVERATAALPHVSAPTLVIQSREDNRIAPADAERAFGRLGAPRKQLVWVEHAGHVLTVDYGRERVFGLLGDWLDRYREPARALA